MSGDGRHTLIVGGGVVGLACAYYLSESGMRVTVIDKGRVGGACSERNCGLVCPSHVLPLAEPGAIRSGLKAILKPGSAFRIRPRLNPSLWRWLWKFARRCNQADMIQSGHAIQPLLASSMRLYEELVQREALDCEWQKQGLLFVYQHKKQLDAYEPLNEMLTSEFGEPARRFDGQTLYDFEPALKQDLAGAWYFEHDAHLRPERLLSSWRDILQQRNVRFVENCQLRQLEQLEGTATVARTSGESIDADMFVVATGAWTPQLADILQCRVPIEPGKGYSLMVPRPTHCPKVPMIFPEHRVAVTPLETGIRLGSIMEFAGYDDRIRSARLRILTEGAAHYLRDPIPQATSEPWYGWRPMTHDSTPVIGPCPGFSNVFLATGHNMLGLSMAPATGRLISELITRSDPHIAPEPYSVNRFLH